MPLINARRCLFVLCMLFVGSGANHIVMTGDDVEEKAQKEETVAYETFGSPIFGSSNILPPAGVPLNGKSAYNPPLPSSSVVPVIPASFSAYLTALGLGNSGPYSGLNYLQNPFASAYRSYYGMSPYVPNSNYIALGTPYTSRMTYPTYSYTYPGYGASVTYRYGGVTPTSSVVASPASGTVIGVSAPVAGYSIPAAAFATPVAEYRALGDLVPASSHSKDSSARNNYHHNNFE